MLSRASSWIKESSYIDNKSKNVQLVGFDAPKRCFCEILPHIIISSSLCPTTEYCFHRMFFRPDLSFSRVAGAILEEKEMKVFIADDSKVIVERLADLLRDIPGVELTGQAGDAPEAMRCIEEKKPDALILDLQMPGGSGLEVLRAIRPDHPALQILVCTNYAYPQYREECLSAGANYFLDKSAEFEKIPAILGELIKNFAKSAPAARQT